jgi:hypothetical protein
MLLRISPTLVIIFLFNGLLVPKLRRNLNDSIKPLWPKETTVCSMKVCVWGDDRA